MQASILARSTQLSAQHREYVSEPRRNMFPCRGVRTTACGERATSVTTRCSRLLLITELLCGNRYLAKHPALTELMHDFLTNVLVNKPDDCFQFCQVRLNVDVGMCHTCLPLALLHSFP